MWQETKHGLFKQFNFIDFKEAFDFMTQIATIIKGRSDHLRWENEDSVVQLWLSTRNQPEHITDEDRQLAKEIDGLLKDGEPTKEWVDESQAELDKIKLYADGGSRGNPGPSASGYVLLDENDKILVDKGVYLGITTNNQAEYTALKLGLEDAKKRQINTVDVYMDSLLVINQMRGIFKVRNRDLWPIHAAITDLSKEFKHVSFTHVPRELNKLADAAVNRALDEALGITN
jgi:ribonuclease HI/pterin-4a-carbinolamine dehydratase